MSDGGLLAGVRVVDLTQYLAGPTVTRLLAEMGADIVKIERPPGGDPSRSYAIVKEGRSGYFVQQNRGKKSLCIDIDHPDGLAVMERLLGEADVFVENTGPGVLERRGLDWASLSPRHPRLVMASVSGFGRTSPLSDRTAFDLIAQAFSGMMALTGTEDGPPMPVGTSVGDVMAGVHAVAAIGFALYHRERTGRGQHIDIAMVDALFHAHEVAVQGPSLTGMRWRPKRSGHQSRLNAPMGAYPTTDGWIVVQVMENQWPGFCRAMGREDLLADERFVDLTARQKHRQDLHALVEAWTSSMPSAAVLERLEAQRVPCAPVLEPADAIGHPYFEGRRAVREVHDPVLGSLSIPGNPLRFSEQPDDLELVAPLLGEHNEAVLRELGYDDATIAALHSCGVLHRSDR